MISRDLPFAQKRWFGAAWINQVRVVPDHYNVNFGEKFGVLVKELRMLRRALFVVFRKGRAGYIDYLPSFGLKPNFDAVLVVASTALTEWKSNRG